MSHATVLHETHVAAGARMTDFAGWRMPLHYGSQLAEHHAVRRSCGIFDVSHMTIVDLSGNGVLDWLGLVLANDPAKLATPGQGLYSCLLNEKGGVIDDLIAYWLPSGGYRLVLNAATRARDMAWLSGLASDAGISLAEQAGLAMLAIQGPDSASVLRHALPKLGPQIAALAGFHSIQSGDYFIARTGYTGEDGFEVVLPAPGAVQLWQQAVAAGAQPCGLAARDTLRLEAGLHLYGQDMDESVSPLECGLAWTVAWSPSGRSFIGREALEAQRQGGVTRRMAGLLLEDRGIMRPGQRVDTAAGPGQVTSGGWSPSMERSIAMARLPAAADELERCTVTIRDQMRQARIVRLPFVRRGRVLVQL
ncbi:MAG: glycine cleavage system aminomethyltransferase GcvT [Chromatiales bacterium]|nr:glycine cleavage system aminomethyltransferase GcvT [Chromatiales bacterium]MCC5863411.1 glycine cleavage system aminomethyltransferase GcvT [Gammaproteobacteria bacterium]